MIPRLHKTKNFTDKYYSKNATDKISSANSGDDPPQNEEVMNHEEEQMDEDTESKTELSIEVFSSSIQSWPPC